MFNNAAVNKLTIYTLFDTLDFSNLIFIVSDSESVF